MKGLKGTRTEKNLLASFAGESQAGNRYTFFASKARKEGFIEIAQIFEETAENEKEHAKRFFKFLQGGEVEIKATFPAGVIGSTAENLEAAADGEHLEHTVLYPEAANIADEEGFPEIAAVFRNIAKVEEQHEKRYRAFLERIKQDKIFKQDKVVKWKCLNCGYIHEGDIAPEKCPACAHDRKYFAILTDRETFV